MSNENALPDGISLNKPKENLEFDKEIQKETINSSVCSKCPISFESVLFTDNNRHSGQIILKVDNGDSIVWNNSLPKDRVRSIKLLDEALQQKLDIHSRRHKND
jgi:hypothetical protein